MNWIHTHLLSVQVEVQVIFFGILAAGLFAYSLWARPNLLKAQEELEDLAKTLEGCSDIIQARSEIGPVLERHPSLKAPWEATQSRVMAVGAQDKTRFMLLGGVDDAWRVERLLQRRFNLAMFEAIPNIAVGVGLFFTFLFLTLALTGATAALNASDAQANPMEATKNLLDSAGGKFLSSLAGLFVSLAWTIAGRRRFVRLERASARVVDAIEALWPPVGAEAAVAEQLTQLNKMGTTLVAQHGTQTQHHGLAEEQLAVSSELLEEAREQTGSLKRFETDLAVSIGNAITNSFGPQMEQMTARLEQAIISLSDRIGSMNEDALRKMMEDFSKLLRSNTDSEMERFRETLTTLAVNLQKASDKLESGVGGAAEALGEATKDMTSNLAVAAQGLVESVKGMDAAMDKAKASVQEVDSTISRAATLGAVGLGRVEQTIESTEGILQKAAETGSNWMQVSGRLEALTAGLTEACDAVEELSQEQRSVVSAVRSATPEALQAVTRMSDLLDGSARSAAQSLGSVQSAMDKTSRDLSGVVTSITEGLVQYTQEVAQLHRVMDAEMAKAVGKLGGAVQNLDETIGELTDSLESFEGKR